MYIDTHCHLSQVDYEDLSVVIQNAKNNGVLKMIVSGCDRSSIAESIVLCEKEDSIYLTLGYHPESASLLTEQDLSDLEDIIRNHPRIVGIGEIGLDYHYGKETKDLQMYWFRRQLELAVKYQKPVVIHSRDAVEDTIQILKEYPVTGVIHCFSGSFETANIYLSMGFKLGIGGVVTFSNSHLKDVVSKLSLNDIVLETDSPYLAPTPVRGSQNEPKNIPYIAQMIADLKHTSCNEVASITSQNAKTIFDLER